jgi:hypothetical protein
LISGALAAGLVVGAFAPPAAAQERPSLNANRWAEDWSVGGGPAYKNMALGAHVRLDFGADARWKAEAIASPRFGLSSQSDDTWLAQRLMAHANVRFGANARAFVQVGAFDTIGKRARGSNDENRVDLQQGFFEATQAREGGNEIGVRVGRQEMTFASARFLDLGDSSNVRVHYDAARVWLTHGRWRFDAFSGAQVRNEPGAFDDDWVDGQHLYGAQLERRIGRNGGLRFFSIDMARESFTIAGTTANDRRRTIGVDVNAAYGAFDFDAGLVRQFGDFGTQEVEAWGGALEVIRRFSDARMKPRLGARFTYGSGDSDPNDGVQESYAPPLPRGSWFSEGGFSSHSNVFEAAAIGAIEPMENVTLTLKLSGLWRPETGDFVYASSHNALAGTRGGDSFIGFAPNLQARWRLSEHVEMRAQAVYVDVSDRIEAAGGENAAYANLSLALRY